MENQRQTLLEQAKQASTAPGVYLMKDQSGVILYVGKAKVLRSRISSYFQKAEHESPRTQMLVGKIDHFDVILTETEAEALILECTLIKKHRPRFNVMLKDDKTYPYIRIQVQDDHPRLEWTRRVRKDGARYFGPFPSAWSARQVLKLLTEEFQLRDCSDNTFRHRSRACILYQMEKCSAPCVEMVSQVEYRNQIEQAIEVLEGRGEALIQKLTAEMDQAAEEMEYEVAAQWRDQIQNIQIVTQTQGVVEPGQKGLERNRDVIGIAQKGSEAQASLLQIRSGRLIAVRHFHLQNTDSELSQSAILLEFLGQYYYRYDEEKSKEPLDSEEVSLEKGGVYDGEVKEVLVTELPDELEWFDQVRNTSDISIPEIRVPETKEDHRLLNVAQANAQHALETQKRAGVDHGVKALEEIQTKLHLDRLPTRIECYDISNIQGDDAVASRVVFVDGAPDKNLYRRYKIKTVEGANDFAMMKEVLGRRFSREEDEFPQLVVVDGGKGQLSQAVAILEELNVQGVQVVGLAKARTESDFKSKEVDSTQERIFIPNRKNPIPLYPQMSSYKLLTHIRDEAHRFAVSYHRMVRSKRTLKGRD